MPTSRELAIAIGGTLLGITVGRYAAVATAASPEPAILRNNPKDMQILFINPNDPVQKALNNLQTSNYEQGMRETGYVTFEPINTGLLTGTANREKGLNVRAYPTTNEEISPVVGTINAGEPVSWYGEFPSLNPDGSMIIFGLRADNSTYFAIRKHNLDGTIEWYVNMATKLAQGPDGAYNFGEHGSGPSTADQKAVNRR